MFHASHVPKKSCLTAVESIEGRQLSGQELSSGLASRDRLVSDSSKLCGSSIMGIVTEKSICGAAFKASDTALAYCVTPCPTSEP